jgi:hypothetical protein
VDRKLYLLALIACVTYGLSNRPSPTAGEVVSQGQQDITREHQDSLYNHNNVTKNVVPITTERDSSQERGQEEKRKDERNDKPSTGEGSGPLVLAIVSIIIAAGAAVFTYMQWRTAEKVAAKQLRAYVGVGPAEITEVGDSNQPMVVRLESTNYGQTPALRCDIKASLNVLPYPLTDSSILPDPEWDKQAAVMYPKEANPQVKFVIITLSEEERREVFSNRKAKKAVYVHGMITYNDIFGQRHSTRFCYCAVPTCTIMLGGAPKSLWVQVAERNSAD